MRRFARILVALLAFVLLSVLILRHPIPAAASWRSLQSQWTHKSELSSSRAQSTPPKDDALSVPHGAIPDKETLAENAKELGLFVPTLADPTNIPMPTRVSGDLANYKPVENDLENVPIPVASSSPSPSPSSLALDEEALSAAATVAPTRKISRPQRPQSTPARGAAVSPSKSSLPATASRASSKPKVAKPNALRPTDAPVADEGDLDDVDDILRPFHGQEGDESEVPSRIPDEKSDLAAAGAALLKSLSRGGLASKATKTTAPAAPTGASRGRLASSPKPKTTAAPAVKETEEEEVEEEELTEELDEEVPRVNLEGSRARPSVKAVLASSIARVGRPAATPTTLATVIRLSVGATRASPAPARDRESEIETELEKA